MAWLQADLDEIQAAIKALASGAQSYTYGGRTVTKASLAELRSLRQEMKSEVGGRKLFARAEIARRL